MAVEKILLQFEADIKDLKSELSEVKSQLGNVEKQTEQAGSKITNTFKNVGKAIAGAFAVREVIRFAGEVDNLARQAEGVKKAFDRIATPGSLEALRAATRGTVSDLQLMQNAVKASNFQIPLEQLGKLFSFANQRARETGESVDYLVDSIVLGIGRKSPLILDNLGISAVRLRKEFKGLGVESAEVGDVAAAVGRIIDEEMSKGAGATTAAADAADRAKASYENLKVELGRLVTEGITPARLGFNKMLEDIIQLFNKDYKTALEQTQENLELARLRQRNLGLMMEVTQGRVETFNKSIKDLNDQLASTKGVDARREIIEQIAEMADQIVQFNDAQADESIANSNEQFKASGYAIKDANVQINRYVQGLINAQEELEGKKSGGGVNKALKTHLQIIDELYPPTVGLALAVENLGKAFAYMGQDSTAVVEAMKIPIVKAFGEMADSSGKLEAQTESLIRRLEEAALVAQAKISASYDIAGSSVQAFSEISDQQTEKYISNLQAQLDAGQITSEQFEKLQKERLRANAKAQKAAAVFDIILSTSQAIMNALTIKPAAAAAPAAIAAGVIGALQLAVATNAALPAFAKGVVDLKGEGTETSDSIFAKLSKGESVITAKGTRQDKGLFEAANKLELEKYINENYVLPALMQKKKDEGAMFDDYRLWLATMGNKKAFEKGSKDIVAAIKSNKYDPRRYWA